MERDTIKKYYHGEIEKDRLEVDHFKLEGIRTKEIIDRYLTAPGIRIVDIGGGAGFYSFWLQSLGHHVSMVDLSPKNIELANEYAAQHGIPLDSCKVGDATDLSFEDNQFDMAILLGPLYHLTEKKERIKALLEAKRVIKSGGLMFVGIISRYASLLDGLKRNLIEDDQFQDILINDLQSGTHRNNTENPEYFTTAFFHTPVEIKNEISKSVLSLEKLVAIESVGWLVDNLDEKMKDQPLWIKIKTLMNTLESNPDLIAMSPHILAIARKP